jgi:hypothetical protein
MEFGETGCADHEQSPPHQWTHAAEHYAKLIDRNIRYGRFRHASSLPKANPYCLESDPPESPALEEEEVREVINGLLRKAGAVLEDGKQVLDLEAPLDLSTMFLDTTCVKANIHFPVDWVLLRDGVKSLMQSVDLIRSHGLKSPMCEPQEFITKINRLSMEMTHTGARRIARKSASGCCER